MRLIDPNALADYANNQKDKTIDANDIMRFPAYDAEFTRRARWEDSEAGPTCSLCGKVTSDMQDEIEELPEDFYLGGSVIMKGTKCFVLKLPNYCSRCGARMDA